MLFFELKNFRIFISEIEHFITRERGKEDYHSERYFFLVRGIKQEFMYICLLPLK